jgi:ABC-type transporter MlaC component
MDNMEMTLKSVNCITDKQHSSKPKGKILPLTVGIFVILFSFAQQAIAEASSNENSVKISNTNSDTKLEESATVEATSNDSSAQLIQVTKPVTRQSPKEATKQATKLSKLSLNTSSLEADYSTLIESIDNTLVDRYNEFKSKPKLLYQFVDQHILPYWNVELTLKQLLGSKHWKSLTKQEVAMVKQAFVDTLNRYVAEGMKFYDGQRIKFAKVKINQKQTRGLLTLTLEPIYLPAFNVSFKIANQNEQWQLYDVMVEGISYVKMKKGEYRQLVSKNGIEGLLAHLDQKNQTSEPRVKQQQTSKDDTLSSKIPTGRSSISRSEPDQSSSFAAQRLDPSS